MECHRLFSRNHLTIGLLAGLLAICSTVSPAAGQSPASQAEMPTRKTIRVGLDAGLRELVSAARAYEQRRPGVVVTFDSYGADADRLKQGQIDAAAQAGDMLCYVRMSKTFAQDFPDPPIQTIFGYWPIAVAVHPSNPLEQITIQQLRRLLTEPDFRWKDLGRPTDGRIRLYMFHGYQVAEALNLAGPKSEPLSGHRLLGDKHRLGVKVERGKVPDLADDPDGIALWYHDRKLAASGYKILPVAIERGSPAKLPTDTAAIASGAYPLRTPLYIMIPASAPEHVKAFVEWLSTPDAAVPFRSGGEWPTWSRWPAAHVSEAHTPVAAMATTRPAEVGQEKESFDGQIHGAVAILPAEPLSLRFRMADSTQHAAYEDAISRAIAADGRLRQVDRNQLARVLAERRLSLLGIGEAPPKAIVSADVVVISHTITEGLRAFVRIRAYSGATGRLLDELKVAINPADPHKFAASLERSVGDWWPGVLRRLRDSRQMPVWSLLDVRSPSLELLVEAAAIRTSLHAALDAEPMILAAHDHDADGVQQEILLRILGLASPTVGRFSPVADYVVDASLTSGSLTLRLRDAAMEVIAEEVVTGDLDKLNSAAHNWLKRQVSAKPRQATAGNVAGDVEQWARRQAKAHIDMWRQTHRQIRELGLKSGSMLLDVYRSRQDLLYATWKEHARMAAQLDPGNEEAAYAALPGYSEMYANRVVTSGDNLPPVTIHLASLDRFLAAFPKSKHVPDVLAKRGQACQFFASRAVLPPAADENAIRAACARKALADCESYLTQYANRPAETADDRLSFYGYLDCLGTYLRLLWPSVQEQDALVEEWAGKFDAREDIACHSDFVRLVVLHHRQDRAGVIALVMRMQQRWPDPKHPQWGQASHLADRVNSVLKDMFPAATENMRGSFELWTKGEREIGDIPKPGYKLKDERSSR